MPTHPANYSPIPKPLPTCTALMLQISALVGAYDMAVYKATAPPITAATAQRMMTAGRKLVSNIASVAHKLPREQCAPAFMGTDPLSKLMAHILAGTLTSAMTDAYVRQFWKQIPFIPPAGWTP